jgi:outer membrane lipoprotein-sorting protein
MLRMLSRLWSRAPVGVAGIAYLSTLLLLLLVAGVSAAPPDFFDELHTRIAAAEAKRQTVRARFTETTTSSLLAKPIVWHGTLLGAKPNRIVINYPAPERKTIVMDGNRLVVVRPDRGENERLDITEIMKQVNHYFANASPAQLRRAFTIRAFPDPDMPGSYQMDLVPKRKEIKQGLEHLQIWVSSDYMLSQITITFAGGDTGVFKLDRVELNVAISPNAFDVDIPPARK